MIFDEPSSLLPLLIVAVVNVALTRPCAMSSRFYNCPNFEASGRTPDFKDFKKLSPY